MRFSIVIPAHNGERYLSLAIESALSQVRKADEIIVVDDASTDQTAKIAQSEKFKDYIKYFYNERASGFVDAWNRAIEKASGDFVTILHQDDLLHPEYLYHIEKALQKFPQVRHLYTGCNYINELGILLKVRPQPHSIEPKLYSGKEYAKSYLNGVITNQHIHRCPGVTTDRKLLLDQCTYRKEAGHIADDDFFLRVGAFTDVVGISQPLASFRHHAQSTTSTVDSLSLKLAEDYVFQSHHYQGNKTLLDPEDITKINQQAVKFITRLLFQSLLYKRRDWMFEAIALRKEFEKIIPSFMERNLPMWAKLLWRLSSDSTRRNHIGIFYVSFLNLLIKFRNLIR